MCVCVLNIACQMNVTALHPPLPGSWGDVKSSFPHNESRWFSFDLSPGTVNTSQHFGARVRDSCSILCQVLIFVSSCERVRHLCKVIVSDLNIWCSFLVPVLSVLVFVMESDPRVQSLCLARTSGYRIRHEDTELFIRGRVTAADGGSAALGLPWQHYRGRV